MAQNTTVADILAKRILETGCKTLFALAGATYAPLLMAFEDGGGKVIGGRHEAATVGAADGYARRTGRIGFACIIAEQALANALTAILTAHESRSPLVVIATRYPDGWIEPAATHIVDRHDFTRLTKFSRTVPSPERVEEYFLAACKAAQSDVPGPALLVIPMNMISQPASASAAKIPQSITLPVAESLQIENAVSIIAQAQRPIAVVDEGAAWAECAAGLTAIASLGIPVLGNGLGRGLVAENEPTGYPWPYAQRAAALADLVIVVGAQMNMWFGYGRAPRFGSEARFIHISSSAEAIGRNVAVELPIVAHPGRTVAEIARALTASNFKRDPEWLVKALEERKERVTSFIGQGENGIHQIEIGAALDEMLPKDRIVVCDGADILNFTFAKLRIHKPRSYADHLPYGAMGMGLPLAIGFAAAEAEMAAVRGSDPAPTVHITGDGSVGFFLAELDTMRRAGLYLTVVVSNDAKWGTEYHGQQLAYGRTANTELGMTDYAAIAAAFGGLGTVVSDRSALRPAIEAALRNKGPSLIDVRIDPMGGSIRKKDPLLGMIIFEEVAKNVTK